MSSQNELFEVFRFIVDEAESGQRLDRYLADQDLDLTRSRLKNIIDMGNAVVNGALVRPAQKLKSGQEIVLKVPPIEPLSALPENIPIDIQYEDESVLVVNKPQGLVVHPAPGHSGGTLVNAILFIRTAAGGDPLRPGIVHRLDKDTSGLMVIAKNEQSHSALARQFHEHTVDRCYKVIVAGTPPDKGEWQTLHGRRPNDRRLFSSKVKKGKPARSRYITIERFKGAAFLEVTLLTGRTHQVRVHCHDHDLPVLGDPWYGPRHLSPELGAIHKKLPGQALHAAVLGFDHPATGKRVRFESPLPKLFADALADLRELSA